MKYLMNITRLRTDGLNTEVYPSYYLVQSQERLAADDALKIIADAAKAFLKTDDGKAAMTATSNDFNWGDIETYIPAKFLAARGIQPLEENWSVAYDRLLTAIVNQDAHL